MTEHLSPEAAAAAALAHLLAGHPELGCIAWTVGGRECVLTGHRTATAGTAEVIDRCSEVMGGTVLRSTERFGDRGGQGVAQLVTVYRGVPVHVYGTYELPGQHGLTSDDLNALFAARPLGTVAVLPAVAL
ncbi:hypothetical protein ACKI16_29835 [Streptomyces scabiei]|uniref:hypothetical protein n=1 Tax=Streptomyces scabiei TaxID=1930 RepID=UPI0038F777D7